MGLFAPVWMTDKTKKIPKAVAAVKNMDDPGQLREVALHAKLVDIKLAACTKIDDPIILAEVATTSGSYIAKRLLKRLSGNNDLLKQVALKYAHDGELAAEAVDGMSAPRAADLAEIRLAVTNAHCTWDKALGRTKVFSDMNPMEQKAYQEAKTQVAEAIGRALEKITDSEEMYAAIKTLCAYGWSVPGYSNLLDRLTPEQLSSLAQEREVNQEVCSAARKKAGHSLDSH